MNDMIGSSIDAGTDIAQQNQIAAGSAAPKLIVTSGVEAPPVTLGIDAVAVATAVSAIPPENTTPEEELLAALQGWRTACLTRWQHLLTGMANSPAEALRFCAELEMHLADTITLIKTTPPKGE